MGARGRLEPLQGSVMVGMGMGRVQLTAFAGQTVSPWWERVDSLPGLVGAQPWKSKPGR